MIAALVATNLVLGIVAILMLKPRRENLCDGCDCLVEKSRNPFYRYRCTWKCDWYSKSPLYCTRYKPRKTERSEGE